MGPTTGLLQTMLEHVDEKHDAAHKRLRTDLTEGLNELHSEISALRSAQQADHITLVKQGAMRERRHELSGYKAVIIAAAVGGGFRLVEVILTEGAKLYGR